MSSCAAFCYTSCPKGFVRVRHFGFLANRRRATTFATLLSVALARCHKPRQR